MEVRKLTAKDVFTVASILGKCGTEASKVIGSLLDGGENYSATGIAVISVALQYAESDIKKWFCSLVGKTEKEFDGLDFDAPLEIIEKLVAQEDIPAFFERAKGLVKTFMKK